MNKFDELVAKLEELFELDKADLDFGIHRIIKKKHKQIQEYLHKRLPEKVRQVLSDLAQNNAPDKLNEVRQQCGSSFGVDAFEPDRALAKKQQPTPPGKQYMETFEPAQQSVDAKRLEAEVYSHLYEFFSRYYENGDFMSLRRYSNKQKYAIPYNGEEIILHWANKDQYYIKSSENLKDYTFTIEEKGHKLRVKFKLTRMDAVQNNNKAVRAFVIDEEADIETTADTLVIPFHLKIFDHKPTAKQVIERLEADIEAKIPARWKKSLWADDQTYTGKDTRTILQKHLQNFTKKSTGDYFIHKDLGGFLRQELDFYIKNEVMYLDDVDDRPANYLEGEIRKIKAIRAVAKDLIDFLAQFEDFQKKLWLKKKFIVETNYCITLDRVPEELYPVIVENERQWEEWRKLGFIGEAETPSPELLKEKQYMMLDTAFYPEEFKYKLLASIDDIDEQTDGLLIHSENFQALNLLQVRYREQVKCIYIDPPYNTEKDDFLYKDGYKHSSWATLLSDRLSLSSRLQHSIGLLFISIDEHEVATLRHVASTVFDTNSFAAELIWNTQHSQQNGLFSPYHEYVQVYSLIPSNELDNFEGGDGEIEAGAMKKISRANPESEFDFPAGVPWLADDGVELSGTWGGTEKVTLVRGRMVCEAGKLKCPVTLKAGWTQKKQMEQFFYGNRPVYDTKGQEVTGFFFTRTGKLKITKKRTRITPSTLLPKFGTVSNATANLTSMFGEEMFGRPKPVKMVQYLIGLPTTYRSTDFILDYFAGSGTTGHAVIDLNREDGGKRKYILVEMGDYFDTVLKPRIQKVIYSKDWLDGKPTAPETGVSHCFKYIRLESYEDTLNNLELEDRQVDLLGLMEEVQEEYLLHYMLDVETRGSLLNLDHFEDPFNYTLKIYNRETGKAEPKRIDLPDTFNYLLGLRVRKMRIKDGFLTIEGENPAGETVLVIWRNAKEKDNVALEEFVTGTLRINPADTEYKAIYINGDTTLNDPHNKIMLTEEVFLNLMFDVESL